MAGDARPAMSALVDIAKSILLYLSDIPHLLCYGLVKDPPLSFPGATFEFNDG